MLQIPYVLSIYICVYTYLCKYSYQINFGNTNIPILYQYSSILNYSIAYRSQKKSFAPGARLAAQGQTGGGLPEPKSGAQGALRAAGASAFSLMMAMAGG